MLSSRGWVQIVTPCDAGCGAWGAACQLSKDGPCFIHQGVPNTSTMDHTEQAVTKYSLTEIQIKARIERFLTQ